MNNDSEFRLRSPEWKQMSPHPASRTPHSTGFTLIEVLLAMAILVVIMSVVYGSFSTAGRNVEQAETSRDETDLARTLISRLSDDIANAYVNAAMNSQAKITVFYGTKEEVESGSEKVRRDSISLTTLTNFPRPDTQEMDLWEVGYFFKEKPEGQGYAFYRREKRILNKDVPALEGGDEYEITDRVRSLQLRYTNDEKNWVDEWKQDNLPKAVEITLVLNSGKAYVTQVDVGSIAR